MLGAFVCETRLYPAAVGKQAFGQASMLSSVYPVTPPMGTLNFLNHHPELPGWFDQAGNRTPSSVLNREATCHSIMRCHRLNESQIRLYYHPQDLYPSWTISKPSDHFSEALSRDGCS